MSSTVIRRKVNRGFQFTIPSRLRKLLGVQEGDLLEIEESDGGIFIRPSSSSRKEKVKRFFALLDAAPNSTSLSEEEAMNLAIHEQKASRRAA